MCVIETGAGAPFYTIHVNDLDMVIESMVDKFDDDIKVGRKVSWEMDTKGYKMMEIGKVS